MRGIYLSCCAQAWPSWLGLLLASHGLLVVPVPAAEPDDAWRSDIPVMLMHAPSDNPNRTYRALERFGERYAEAGPALQQEMAEALREHIVAEATFEAMRSVSTLSLYVPAEVVLPIAWESLAESEDEQGYGYFLHFCHGRGAFWGPEIVPWVLRMAASVDFERTSWWGLYPGEARAKVLRILRNSGPTGTQGIIDLGWYPGSVAEEDLYGDQDPRRHTLLMAKYEQITAEFNFVSRDMLRLLLPGYTSNPEVQAFMRAEISSHLKPRDGDSAATELGELIGLAGATRDEYFVPFLEELSKFAENETALTQWAMQFEGNENQRDHVGRLSSRITEAFDDIEAGRRAKERQKELAEQEKHLRIAKEQMAIVREQMTVEPPPVVAPRDMDVATLVEAFNPLTREESVWEGAAMELADRVATGGDSELAAIFDGLRQAALQREGEAKGAFLRSLFPVLPPESMLDLFYADAEQRGGLEGAMAFVHAVQRRPFNLGPALADRPDYAAALLHTLGEFEEEQRRFVEFQLACALLDTGPAGVRALAIYGWDDYERRECVPEGSDENTANGFIRAYGERSADEPWRRVDLLARLVSVVPYSETAQAFLRAELPAYFALRDHPEGARTVVYAGQVAVATEDAFFIELLREAAGALRVKDPEAKTTPAPRIEGGWAAAFQNMATKLDEAAERLAAVVGK